MVTSSVGCAGTVRPTRQAVNPLRFLHAAEGSLQNLPRSSPRIPFLSAPLRRFKTGTGVANTPGEGGAMWTIFVILVIMWLLGMVSSYTLGGFLHLLLILAIAIVLIRIIQGRRPI
jgi:hypothetical protein